MAKNENFEEVSLFKNPLTVSHTLVLLIFEQLTNLAKYYRKNKFPITLAILTVIGIILAPTSFAVK